MTKPATGICPKCGAVLPEKQQHRRAAPVFKALREDREYDHRGVMLPRRTRVGGIIAPQ